MKQTFFLCGCVATLCLCLSCRTQQRSTVASFLDKTLLPVELNGTSVAATDTDDMPTLIFHTKEMRISGYSGCNNFFGNYELNGNLVTFSKIGATKRACIGIGDTLEREMFEALHHTTTLKIDGDTLQLLNKEQIVGKFIVAPAETK